MEIKIVATEDIIPDASRCPYIFQAVVLFFWFIIGATRITKSDTVTLYSEISHTVKYCEGCRVLFLCLGGA